MIDFSFSDDAELQKLSAQVVRFSYHESVGILCRDLRARISLHAC